MARRLHFGPAGKPTTLKSGDYVKAIEVIAGMGLDAIEYEAVRGVRISEAKARAIAEAAERYGVIVSMHAPYFINFASPDKQTVEKSRERLIASVRAASWMNAYAVVFHPGYYKGNSSPEEALQRTIENLRSVDEYIEQQGIKGVWIAPETTGRTAQVGSVEEVVAICRELRHARPAVDWAHIHARSLGKHVVSVDDVVRIVEYIERELGTWAVKPLHTHFSKIGYGEGGEKEHHTLAEGEYGPDWRIVCRAYKNLGIEAVVISESPILEQDALVMKKICEDEG